MSSENRISSSICAAKVEEEEEDESGSPPEKHLIHSKKQLHSKNGEGGSDKCHTKLSGKSNLSY